MKRIGNLFDRITSIDNLVAAHYNARKGKAFYREVKMVDGDLYHYASQIKEMLESARYKVGDYYIMTKTVDSGKVREIYRLDYYPHRIIHHAILQVLEPIWVAMFIKSTYCCIKGRGIHLAAKHIKRDLLRDKPGTCYCLKFDIEKFYPSVNNETLKLLLRKKLKDAKVLELLDSIIDSASGLPIGNYLSQYLANLYLNYFDHWIKETKGARYYYRYCDDIVILHSSKEYLHELRREIADCLHKNLKLRLKHDWQVFPVESRGIDFLGYRFFHGYTLLRKRIAKKVLKLSARIEKAGRAQMPDVRSLMSYYGWVIHCNGYHLRRKVYNDRVFQAVKVCCRRAGTNNPLQGRR